MKHIPNILSASRILMIPFFMWQFLIGNTTIAGLILICSGLTDLIDGFLARKFNWVSQLGKVLDPAADKLTLIAVCISAFIRLKAYRIFFIILLLKDLIMLLIGSYLIKKGVKLDGAKYLGKISTVLFYVSMSLLILFPNLPHWFNTTLLTIVVVFAIIAALSYIPDVIRYRKEQMN